MKRYLIVFFSLVFLSFSPYCWAEIQTLSHTGIWQTVVDDQSNQFTLSGHENNAALALILRPNESARLNVAIEKEGYLIGDNAQINFSIDDYALTLSKEDVQNDPNKVSFIYPLEGDELKAFVHALTSKKEGSIEFDETRIPLSLKGTSQSITSILNYIDLHQLSDFPAPFKTSVLSETPAPSKSQIDPTPNPPQNLLQASEPKGNETPHHKENLLMGNILLILFVLFIVLTPFYRIAHKYYEKKRQKKQQKLQNQWMEEQIITATHLCMNEIEAQSHILTLKRAALSYQDEYGTWYHTKWVPEIDRFIDSRIKPLLTAHDFLPFYASLHDLILKKIEEVTSDYNTVAQDNLDKARNCCEEDIEKNALALSIKRSQLSFQDEYGTWNCEKWHSERERFLESRIQFVLNEHKLSHYYSLLKESLILKIEEVTSDYNTVAQDNLDKARNCCEEDIEKNALALSIKRSQLSFQDEYGTWNCEKWHNERERFLESRIQFVLNEHKLSHYYSLLKESLILKIEEVTSRSKFIEKSLNDSDQYSPTMKPYDYERFCAKLLRQCGWEAMATQASGDQGADVVAVKNSIRMVIQCKLYSSPVGNSAVQEIVAARSFYDAQHALVVSNATYTNAATQLALTNKVHLLHHDALQNFADRLSEAS
ncbi:hypothetical protein COMNV_00872 [Commensalibacter sp. Nvir]|uniref:restriction endonuclease n=1 Tax=Commensalibacter sp. Nvir TaxID=3069817 RepID=UPI002D2C022C|nr:hypothetical protein COMNV_00872 [Commensalibacter sp. Nvir]